MMSLHCHMMSYDVTILSYTQSAINLAKHQYINKLLNITNLLHYFADGQQCTTPVNLQAGTDTFNGSSQVISNSGFTCNGRVTGFMISTTDRLTGGNIQPSIQIWHPSGTTYTRLSQYTIRNDDVSNERSYQLATVTLDGNEVFNVEKGDVIGYYIPNGVRNNVWNIQTDGSISYAMSSSGALSIFRINDNGVQVSSNTQPLIQPVFGKFIHANKNG